MTNPYEAHARQKKALALADFIWENLGLEERQSIRLPEALAQLRSKDRDAWAEEAEQHSPSKETWDIVVCRIIKLVGWARESVNS